MQRATGGETNEDSVLAFTIGGGNGAVNVPDDLFLHGNAGDDDMSLVDVTVEDEARIWLEAGRDEIMIAESNFMDDLFVFGHAGNDDVQIVNTMFGDNLTIYTHGDDDRVTLLEVTARNNVLINTGGGEDQIDIGVGAFRGSDVGVTARNLTVYGGVDRDEVDIRDSVIMDRIFVSLGSGNDRLILLNNTANRAFLYGNAGDDAINADFQFANNFSRLVWSSFEIFIV